MVLVISNLMWSWWNSYCSSFLGNVIWGLSLTVLAWIWPLSCWSMTFNVSLLFNSFEQCNSWRTLRNTECESRTSKLPSSIQLANAFPISWQVIFLLHRAEHFCRVQKISIIPEINVAIYLYYGYTKCNWLQHLVSEVTSSRHRPGSVGVGAIYLTYIWIQTHLSLSQFDTVLIRVFRWITSIYLHVCFSMTWIYVGLVLDTVQKLERKK